MVVPFAIETSTGTVIIAVVLILGAVGMVVAAIATGRYANQAFALAGVMIGLLGGGVIGTLSSNKAATDAANQVKTDVQNTIKAGP